MRECKLIKIIREIYTSKSNIINNKNNSEDIRGI